MYEPFYGLTEKPFSLLPDPSFLFLSDKHRMALVLLEYAIANQAGFSVITGAIGAGKTTLIRHLLNQMGEEVTVGLLSNTHSQFGELMRWVLMAFGLGYEGKDRVALYDTFTGFLVQEYQAGRRTVLIVDEAQNLSIETLEQLRMLSNINADKHQVLQTILAGQPNLRDSLRRPELEQFAQRITVDYHLDPLNAAETRAYIRHRLIVAGGPQDLFSEAACAAVFEYTGGTPRLINLLCDTVLVYGYADQLREIDRSLVDEVAREKLRGGLFPGQPGARGAVPAEPTAELPIELPTPAALPRGLGQVLARSGLPVAVMAGSDRSRRHLQQGLELYGVQIVTATALDAAGLAEVRRLGPRALLVNVDEQTEPALATLDVELESLGIPVLLHDGNITQQELRQNSFGYGRNLVLKLLAMTEAEAPAALAQPQI